MEKRYKEIQEMAKAYASHMTSDKDMQVAFADALRRGAEWADSTMINKACEWLEKNVCIGYNFSGDKNTLTIIDDFRKAMKGD